MSNAEWIARWLDQGKPAELIALQRSPALKNELPRVIRPDLLVTEHGLSVTELDSVPGGIGLTGWLNQTYSTMGAEVLGGADGMLRGFASIFGDAPTVHIVVSEEAATYRPEMSWMANQLGSSRFKVQDAKFNAFADGDAVYRFFELFDLANVANARVILDLAAAKRIRLTPPTASPRHASRPIWPPVRAPAPRFVVVECLQLETFEARQPQSLLRLSDIHEPA